MQAPQALSAILPGAWRTEIRRLGKEGAPALIIDNFVQDPDSLVARAAAATFEPVTHRLYPGVRAPVGEDYRAFLAERLAEPAARWFRPCAGLAVSAADFSIVTTRPEALQPYQRTPHYDSNDPTWLALIHYLCRPDLGGTSFYRHNATGFEVVEATRRDAYLAALNRELEGREAPQGYAHGDDALFTRIGGCEAAFNRAVIYFGISLHSGDIVPGFAFDPDPRTGRLTITAFMRMREV